MPHATMAEHLDRPKKLPSSRWTSFLGREHEDLDARLQAFLRRLDRSVLLRHAEALTGKKVTMSEPFSAGQFWLCLEMVVEDGDLIIARVRLPRHPHLRSEITEADDGYAVKCEIATMDFVRACVSGITVPHVYAYEGPGSSRATQVGGIYMLMQGFYGNTLETVVPDITLLPVSFCIYTQLSACLPLALSPFSIQRCQSNN